jgi:hypothetical protein
MWFAIGEAGPGPISAVTNTVLAGGRGRSGVEVGPDQIRVQMGDFKLTVPRASIRSVSPSQADVGKTIGVHHRSGRWLVNGSADGLVELAIELPFYREPVITEMFIRWKVKSLTLSLLESDGFIASWSSPAGKSRCSGSSGDLSKPHNLSPSTVTGPIVPHRTGRISAQPAAPNNKPAGQRLAWLAKAETWPNSG